jgi:cytochrome P450
MLTVAGDESTEAAAAQALYYLARNRMSLWFGLVHDGACAIEYTDTPRNH